MTLPREQRELAEQIAGELDKHLHALAGLFGLDLYLEHQDRPPARAEELAAQLLSGDEKLAAQIVVDMAGVIIPDNLAADDDWWTTPLGRAVAKSVGHPTETHVSYSQAAAILGRTRGRVGQLVHDGTLPYDSEHGGIPVEAVKGLLNGHSGGGD